MYPGRVALGKLREVSNLLLTVLSSTMAQLSLVLTTKQLTCWIVSKQALGLTKVCKQGSTHGVKAGVESKWTGWTEAELFSVKPCCLSSSAEYCMEL